MPRIQNSDDSEDDEKIIRRIGNTRYVKKKHEKTIKESMKGVINEEFIDKIKECKLTGVELKFINDLKIVPFHEVPPQHKVEHQAGSRILSQKEREEFEQIVPIRSGPFSTREDTQIVKNWIKFCEKHRWDHLRPEPFLYMKFAGRSIIPYLQNRIAFVQILARKLPNRTLYSVYHRFRNLNSNHKVSRYSREEDATILEHVRNSNEEDEKKKFAILAKLLNRTRMSVYRRYLILLQQKDRKSKRKTLKQEMLENMELDEEKNEEFFPSSSDGSEDENDGKLKPKKSKIAKKRGRKKKHPEEKKINLEEIEQLSEDDIEDDFTLQLDEEET